LLVVFNSHFKMKTKKRSSYKEKKERVIIQNENQNKK